MHSYTSAAKQHPSSQLSTLIWMGLMILTGLVLMSSAQAKTLDAGSEKVEIVTLSDKLDSPWSMAFLPDGRMLVTEQSGKLRVFENGKLLPQAVSGTPEVVDDGQGGLLDVALHPDFSKNQLVYLTFTGKGKGGTGVEVFRGKLEGMTLKNGEVIFRQQPKIKSNKHFGSRIVFDRQGFLYITMGDRGDQDRAQKQDQHIGTVVRLNDDGSVPQDNPFIGKKGVLPEIYTYGHRNVQGAALHPVTGDVWTNEHGPQGGDELNILKAGTNYGWPVITYGVNYITGTKIGEGTYKTGMAQPIHKWVPSIAPGSMTFYTGDTFPSWKGSLFVTAMRFMWLTRLTLEGDRVVGEEQLLKGIGRPRDIRQGPDEFLYVLTNDKLLQLRPAK
jgi:aldose sugar dehydrogenase